jgi:hypothetical protein
MSEQAPEQVSPAPIVAAAVQVSENQETRDTANAAVEDAQIAQATAEVAGNTALEAESDAQTAAEVAVVSAGIGTEAAISAEEAKQEAGEARTEIGELRQELLSKLDGIHALLQPAEIPEQPANGVSEVTLDESDIGESGIERGSGSETPVSGNSAGSSAEDNSGASSTATRTRSPGLRRGRRR